MSRSNNVRGPASALTEFLREAGITPTTIARRNATRNDANGLAAAAAAAGPSNAAQGGDGEQGEEGEENGEEREEASPRRRTRTSGYASDELDEPDEPAAAPSATKKRKLTKAAEAKLKAAAKKKAKKDGKADSDGEEEDAYTALSKSAWSSNGASSSKPPVGSFETCARCEKQFTVTKYTLAANPPPGFLCHKCAKDSGTDPFKKDATPRKRKAPADKRTVVNFEERRFPTLATICIQIVTKHINDVEALGDIGALNQDEISKALSKNRSLTPENAHLFYDVENTKLTLYDVTKLTPPAFQALASLNPNLTSLRLDFCGRLDDTAISHWSRSLPSLTRLELLGPFLVRTEAWQKFFKARKGKSMEGFLITQSPRFDLACLKALAENAGGKNGCLRELRLKEVGQVSDDFLEVIQGFEGLEYLDLGDPSKSVSDEAAIDLLACVGPTLKHLDFSGHIELTDKVLLDGVRLHTGNLEGLALRGLGEGLTDEGVASFFDTWSTNPPLQMLDLSRNPTLSTLSLEALLNHSSSDLRELNINGWSGTSEEALQKLGKKAKALEKVDIGWCRSVDNWVVKGVVDGCEGLKEMKVWGCNRLTSDCPKKRDVRIMGVEAH